MSDPATPPPDPAAVTPPAPSPAPAPPVPAAVKTFTQEEVDSIVQERLARAARPAPAAAPAPAPAPKPAPKPADPSAPLSAADVQQMLAADRDRSRAFTRSIAGVQIGDKQLARMEEALPAGLSPTEVTAWAASYIEDMGFARPAANAGASTTPPVTPTTTTPATTAPTTPPAAAPTAPTPFTLPLNGGLPDIFNYTLAQAIARGPSGLREDFEKILAVGHANSGAPPRPKLPTK